MSHGRAELEDEPPKVLPAAAPAARLNRREETPRENAQSQLLPRREHVDGSMPEALRRRLSRRRLRLDQ